ncbi:hypothetical protein Cni_G20085 [Canna indica]|uniref:Uncharacterized protein n=1 Tax=Canna indica TaxID=4628 RepID=A0AAQ3QJ69_9LILI|nr:hypothetical protein Cni_G20085 [Canna indica]
MGFFTDAHDLFCISLATKLLARREDGPQTRLRHDAHAHGHLQCRFGPLLRPHLQERHHHPLLLPLLASVVATRFSPPPCQKYSNKCTRGAFIAAIFAMQGISILVGELI